LGIFADKTDFWLVVTLHAIGYAHGMRMISNCCIRIFKG